jgi:hypothetical protein
MRRTLIALSATTALVAAAQVLSSTVVERRAEGSIRSAVAAAGGSLDAVTVRHSAFSGHLSVDLTATVAGAAYSVEGLRAVYGTGPLALFQTASAQDSLSVDRLTRAIGQGSLTISGIQFRGATMSRADVEALMDANAATPLAQRLQRISASGATIRSVEIVEERSLASQRTFYRDLTLMDIRAGKVAEARAAGAEQSVTMKQPGAGGQPAPGTMNVTYGDMRFEEIDIPLMVRFMSEAARPGETPSLFARSSAMNRMSMRFPEGTLAIDSMTVGETRMRPFRTALPELMAKMEADQAASGANAQPSPEVMANILDVFSAFSMKDAEMRGLRGEFKDERGRPVTLAMDAIAMTTDAPAGKGSFAMRGIDIAAPDGKVRVGEFSIQDASFGQLGQVLARTGGDPLKLAGENPRDMIPEIGRIRLGGIDIDVPDTSRRNERVKMRLAAFDVAMSNFQTGIPANTRIDMTGFAMDLPKNSRDEGMKTLLQLGYDSIQFSMRLDQTWNPTSRVLSVNELSLDAPRMIRTNWKLDLGNVTKDVFDKDTAVQAVAALAINARRLSARVENLGLIEKLFEQQAREQRRRAEDIRRELGAGAAMAIPMFLGDHPGAKQLADAVSRFAAQPKSLDVEVTARGEGLSAADFVAMSDPQSLLGKVDIKARAN